MLNVRDKLSHIAEGDPALRFSHAVQKTLHPVDNLVNTFLTKPNRISGMARYFDSHHLHAQAPETSIHVVHRRKHISHTTASPD